MGTTYVEIKDVNIETHRALRILKATCDMYNGCCKSCPIGYYKGGNPRWDYGCALAEQKPKDFKLNDVIPIRLIVQGAKDKEQNNTEEIIIPSR